MRASTKLACITVVMLGLFVSSPVLAIPNCQLHCARLHPATSCLCPDLVTVSACGGWFFDCEGPTLSEPPVTLAVCSAEVDQEGQGKSVSPPEPQRREEPEHPVEGSAESTKDFR